VEVATEAVNKLVITTESHNRVLIMEVMGRDMINLFIVFLAQRHCIKRAFWLRNVSDSK
jgi:hypothetical protein